MELGSTAARLPEAWSSRAASSANRGPKSVDSVYSRHRLRTTSMSASVPRMASEQSREAICFSIPVSCSWTSESVFFSSLTLSRISCVVALISLRYLALWLIPLSPPKSEAIRVERQPALTSAVESGPKKARYLTRPAPRRAGSFATLISFGIDSKIDERNPPNSRPPMSTLAKPTTPPLPPLSSDCDLLLVWRAPAASAASVVAAVASGARRGTDAPPPSASSSPPTSAASSRTPETVRCVPASMAPHASKPVRSLSDTHDAAASPGATSFTAFISRARRDAEGRGRSGGEGRSSAGIETRTRYTPRWASTDAPRTVISGALRPRTLESPPPRTPPPPPPTPARSVAASTSPEEASRWSLERSVSRTAAATEEGSTSEGERSVSPGTPRTTSLENTAFPSPASGAAGGTSTVAGVTKKEGGTGVSSADGGGGGGCKEPNDDDDDCGCEGDAGRPAR